MCFAARAIGARKLPKYSPIAVMMYTTSREAIGGNAFITTSIPANTRVSIKNQELDYKTGHSEQTNKTEIGQSDEWYYII